MAERTTKVEGTAKRLAGSELKVGQKAPDFALRDRDMNIKTLADYGRNVKLVSVVPSLDTDICDQQTRRFNEEAVKHGDVVVITVSVDLPTAQERWCGAAGLRNVITLSDHFDVSFGRDYGVLMPELRLLSRAVFILKPDNTVAYVQYVPEVASHPDYNDVLKVLAGLQ